MEELRKIKNIKVVFVDIDGTLTNSEQQVTEYTKRVIKKTTEKGILVVLCSGRTNEYTCKKSKAALASNYVISSSGAEVYDYNEDKNIYENIIEFEMVKDIWEYAMDNHIGLITNTKDMRFGNKYLFAITDPNKTIIEDVNIIKDFNIFQLVMESKDYDTMVEAEKFISKNSKYSINSYSESYYNKIKNSEEGYFFDITNTNVSKGIAIGEFIKFMNITKDECMCFGDQMNDIEMFKACGNPVAMGNAVDELKKYANYITLTNNEDGVACFLNKYVI